MVIFLAMKWRNFFIGAGIPVAIATRYSKTFSEQRIHFSMLDEIDKNTLIQLGVTAIGDQVNDNSKIYRNV